MDNLGVKTAYDNSPIAVILFESITQDEEIVDLRIIYANESAARFYTKNLKDVVGHSLNDLNGVDGKKLLDAHKELLITQEKKSIYKFSEITRQPLRYDCFYYAPEVTGCFARDVDFGFGFGQALGTLFHEDVRPITEREKDFSRLMEQEVFFKNELYDVEHENDFIAFSQVENHNIIKILTAKTGEVYELLDKEYHGKKCYEVLHNLTEPCSFCAHNRLRRDRYYVWQHHDPTTNKDYLYRSKLVKLDDRYVRMDVAQDITDDRRKSVLVTETMEGMSLWTESISLLLNETSLDDAIQVIIENLCSFFKASSGTIILYGSTIHRVAWAAEGDAPVPLVFENPTKEALDQWSSLLNTYAYGHVLVPDTSDPALPASIRDHFLKSNLSSSQLSPIFIGDHMRGILILDNVSEKKEQLYMADMVAQSIAHSFQQKELQENIDRLRFLDSVTGYFNFDGFRTTAEGFIKNNPDKHYSLWYSDVRRFKYINEIFGYGTGDAFLRFWANTINDDTREGESFCRITADTMAVLRVYEDQSELQERFSKLLSKLHEFSGFKDKEFRTEMVSGIYLLTEEDMANPNINTMMNKANIAQKRAKRLAGSGFTLYDDSMRAHQIRELEITHHLDEALETGEIYIALHPLYDYAKQEIASAEALVRWAHPTLGNLSPAEFIPLLEKSAMISQLDKFVWEEACKLIREILNNKDISHEIPISINISRLDIYLPNLGDFFTGLTEKYDIPPHLLKLEITESAYIADSTQLIEVVESLRSRGFLVSMDDFGSGYSSLNTLKDVPVDALKLDMQFLSTDKESARRGAEILKAIVGMTQMLELPVIAEGVETKSQADYLKSIGCTVMQGYYFARPMSQEDFLELLVESSCLPLQ